MSFGLLAAAVIVVEASRLDHATTEVPRATQVITAQEIATSGAQDMTELLVKQCPQLTISSCRGSSAAGRQLSFMGYGENGFGRALILVDGERLNRADLAAPSLERINLNSIRSVEVLSGPQNVLYGDMASAGVINILTDPVDYDAHGYAEIHGGSWDAYGTSLGYRGGIEDDGIQYWANADWERSGGYRANSETELWNANGGMKWNADKGSFLRASAFYNYTDYELPGALSHEQWRHNPRQSVQCDGFRQIMAGLNLIGYGVVNDENALRMTFNTSQGATECYLDYDLYDFHLKPEWVNSCELFGLDRESVIGSEIGYDRIRADSPYTGVNLLDRLSMAFFGEETLHATEWLTFSVGLRYEREWNRCAEAISPRDIDDLFAYDFAINLTPIDDFKLYVRWSRFFRNAALDEVCYRGGYQAVEPLDPEIGWRTDIGFEYRFLEEFALRADGYLSETDDEIFYNPFYAYTDYGWTSDNVNSPDPVRRVGFDASLSWEREKVAGLSLAVSGVTAEFHGGQYDGNKVPMVPSLQSTLNGRLWLWSDCFIFGGTRYRTATYTISDFANVYERLHDFITFHLGVTYEPTFVSWLQGWKATAIIDNLFDRNYCDYATYGAAYYPADGRCFRLTLRYEF